jgi:ATP-dependent DNA helicase RecG
MWALRGDRYPLPWSGIPTPTPAISLTTPLVEVPGVGAPAAELLGELGVRAVGQLVAYLPSRHEHRLAEAPIAQLQDGAIVTARGEVTACKFFPRGPRPRFQAVLTDETGRLDLVWFNMPFIRSRVHPGMRLRVWGTAKRRGGVSSLQVVNPRIEVLDLMKDEPEESGERWRAVYPASEAMPSTRISAVVERVLPLALPLIEDHLPEAYRKARELPGLAEAYRMMHRPRSEQEITEGRRRLAFDELLLLQLGVALKRAHLRMTLRAPALKSSDAIDRHIRERLPFALTPAQDAVVADLVKDLSSPTPTNRLIQGDVGSGKTAVAVYAMLMAVASQHQAALMAPTELLAEQHAASIGRMLEGSKVKVEVLTGSMAGPERQGVLARVASGETDVLIGTHALLTERVQFSSLALAIIDEQHRFGVHQRAALRSKAMDDTVTPHVVVMTATPIPRTLALTLLGDLDVSTIRGMPPGRAAVRTRVVDPDKAGEVYAFVRERIDAGDQAYVVTPTIDPARPVSELGSVFEPGIGLDQGPGPTSEYGLGSLRALLARLEVGELKGKRVAAVHGRLDARSREHVMHRFRSGLIDALVATSIIEVGVDVPNATVIVVENADRFGLAQLHQLRGRVGRGGKPGVCILIARPTTADGAARLRVMSETTDGFVIAERDLEIRGPGDVFGLRQSGVPPLKVADLTRDADLLRLARQDAFEWIARSPVLGEPDEAVLKRRLLKAHGPWLGLGDVG